MAEAEGAGSPTPFPGSLIAARLRDPGTQGRLCQARWSPRVPRLRRAHTWPSMDPQPPKIPYLPPSDEVPGGAAARGEQHLLSSSARPVTATCLSPLVSPPGQDKLTAAPSCPSRSAGARTLPRAQQTHSATQTALKTPSPRGKGRKEVPPAERFWFLLMLFCGIAYSHTYCFII